MLAAPDPPSGERVRLQEGQHLVEPLEGDGLADEVERAEPQALAGLAFGGDPGDGDDGQRGLADRTELQEVETAHAGQVDVEDDRVGALALQGAEGGLRGLHHDRIVPHLREEVPEHFPERSFILDDEHPHGV